MTRAQRLTRLEAQHQRALDRMVDTLEQDPAVARYMLDVSNAELHLLAKGDTGALQRFALTCPLTVS
jgi:hypothetical protein